MGSRRFVRIVALTLFLVGGGVVYRFFGASGSQSTALFTSPVSELLTGATLTPMPFEEITIPFLRTRKYESTLRERTQISQNSFYILYTTSYQSDGLRVNGLLTIPRGEQPPEGWPAIVFVHGYIPPTQYQTTQNYVSYVDVLARAGFVVFKIDLRGHGDSEGEAGGGYYSADYVVDTLNARAALAASGFVDPAGIGLWGHSMAGNVVMRALASQPEIPAVVIWAGAGYTYTDLSEYRISDNSYRPPPQNTERARKRQLLRETYGEFSEDSPFWRQVAVTDYLSDIKGAIQIHHAVDDTVVSIEYSRNLTRLLDKTRVIHALFEYQTGGHNITGASFTQAMQRTAEFFRERL
jgi:dipeptidyl aminopeptidase/acylaminoacyl peptidase